MTGNISGANCFGREKVNRLQCTMDLGGFDYIYTYGDGEGDREMLALGNERHFKPFIKKGPDAR